MIKDVKLVSGSQPRLRELHASQMCGRWSKKYVPIASRERHMKISEIMSKRRRPDLSTIKAAGMVASTCIPPRSMAE